MPNKIVSTCKEIHDWEQGYTNVPIKILDKIAKALLVNIKALFLGIREYENELLTFIDECKKIEDRKSVAILDRLVQSVSESMEIGNEKVKTAEKIKVANNLVSAGVTIDIIL